MKFKHTAAALFLLVVLGQACMFAQDDPRKYEWGDRDARQNPEHVIEFIGLQAGMVIADVGAGSGYFTVRFAEVVGPAGTVIATDINDDYLEFIKKRVSEAGYENVDYVLAEETDPKLPLAAADIVFLSAVYHHLAEPVLYLQRMRGAFKPEGRLVIVETYRRISSHGSTIEDVVTGAEKAGYRLVKLDESQDRFFIAVFTVVG